MKLEEVAKNIIDIIRTNISAPEEPNFLPKYHTKTILPIDVS